ncbi:MAG TPA: MFS transporter, partial [Rubrivivax sp.]|nr:MFS transporter [Rubrivivax sp.]
MNAFIFERPSLWQRVRPVLGGFDGPLALAVAMLCAIGLVSMYSAGFDDGTRFADHGRNMAIALAVLFVTAQVSPHRLQKLALPLYVVGLALLFRHDAIRPVFLLLCGMGMFFAGVFVVLIPLAVRDLYAGGAQDIAAAMIAFGLGTLTSIAILVRRGGVKVPGRALCISQFTGCAVLVPIALASPAWVFYASVFAWGMSGGVAMTMSRTIMQEQAPPSHRSRVMAAFSIA